jgi:tetratricopeptide (TPR) repeat protein
VSESAGVTELLRRGIAAAKAGRKQEAQQILMSVVELDERNEQAWLWLSGVVDSLADRLVCVENVLAINPNNTKAQAGLKWLKQQGIVAEHAADQDICARCGARLPAYGKLCTSCGLLLVIVCPGCGEYLEAEERNCPSCGESVGNWREGATYYTRLASAYLSRGQHILAQEALPYALAEGQDDPQVLVDAAALYERLGESDRVVAIYERIVELGHADGGLYARLGELYRKRGMDDKAQTLYLRAQQQIGDDPEVILSSARQNLARDPVSPQAVTLLERVMQAAPERPEPYLYLARIYRTQDEMEVAVKHYRRAVQLTDANSALGREVRRELNRLDIAPTFEASQGWGEVVRTMGGLVLLPTLAALTNAGMSPLRLSPAAWLALLAAFGGAYLWVSGMEVPANPGMCALFGDGGAEDRSQQMSVGLSGVTLWFLALGAILLRV